MDKKILPEKLTKKMLFEIYKPIPKKVIRWHANHCILKMGKNVRIRILPEYVIFDFILRFGIPDEYKLSDEHQRKLIILNNIRTKKNP